MNAHRSDLIITACMDKVLKLLHHHVIYYCNVFYGLYYCTLSEHIWCI